MICPCSVMCLTDSVLNIGNTVWFSYNVPQIHLFLTELNLRILNYTCVYTGGFGVC